MPSHVAPSVRRALLAAAAIAAFGGLTAPRAHAAFTLGECQGAAVKGAGSSFQNALQATMKQLFEQSVGCAGTASDITSYTGNGSGDGNAEMGGGGGDAALLCAPGCSNNPAPLGQRDPNVSYAATDEPPTPTAMQGMRNGQPGTADDAIIHVIPVATGASAFIVHAPEGCILGTVQSASLTSGTNGTAGGADTGDSAANHTQRIRLSSAMLEAAFAGDSSADTWGEIAPGISGTATGITGGDQTNNGVACANVPVRRIVRHDTSGTTFNWKAYLNLINPNRHWLTTYSTPDNRVWPPAGGSGAGVTPVQGVGAACTGGAGAVCANLANGGGQEAAGVNATDGSIGYVDLATARGAGFDMTPHVQPGDPAQDYTFWSPLQNKPGAPTDGFVEPTFAAAAGHATTGVTKGANCSTAVASPVPTPANSPNGDPTQGDWSGTTMAGGSGYPACILTYVLAWDDNAPVYGTSAAEQAKARTVKDYLQKVVVGVGQGALLPADYSPLPNSDSSKLLTYAQDAVAAIGWNKAAGSGGGGGGTTTTPGGGTTTTPGGGTPVGPPSNVFSLPSHKLSSTLITYTVQVPGKGKLKIVATTKVGRKTITGASISTTVSGGGKVTVKLKLSAKARSALAHAHGRKLKFIVKFTFTPTGGTARTVSKTVTLVAPKPKKRH